MRPCDKCGTILTNTSGNFPLGNYVFCTSCAALFSKNFMPRWDRQNDINWKQFHELLEEFLGQNDEKVLLT